MLPLPLYSTIALTGRKSTFIFVMKNEMNGEMVEFGILGMYSFCVVHTGNFVSNVFLLTDVKK